MKKSYYIYNSGTLKREDNSIILINEDGIKKGIPIETIEEIYIMNEMNLNSKVINFLYQYNIRVHFFNYYHFYTGTFYPKETLISGKLLVNQVEHYSNIEKRLVIAQKIVDSASYNIYRNLRYYNGRDKDLEEYMKTIESLRRKIYKTSSISELMGYEGNIRKVYYKAWNIIVDQKIDFEKRVKNPPDNMINTLISFVNTIIYTKILGAIYHTQLNPTISYLHEPGDRRFSLSLDISEIFKPLLADRLIFSMLNKKQIIEKDFTKELNYLHLKESGSKKIMQEIDSRLQKTIKHKDLNKSVSYEYLMRLECYKLIKHLLNEKDYEGFKMSW